jgi:hypothetical protein
MEPSGERAEKKITERTVMLAIPTGVIYSTLKSIQDKGIKCTYMGADESGHLLMQIQYPDSQEETLKKIIKEMQAGEAFMNFIHMLGAEIIVSAVREYKSNERVTKHFKHNGGKQKQSDNAGSKQ